MMQSLRALAAARRSFASPGRRVPPQLRCLSTHADTAAAPNEELQNLVLVEGRASSRNAILNRPSSLNAITTSMAARLTKLYNSWEENPDIGYVVMKGSGRAFCAGGYVVSLYRSLAEGICGCKVQVVGE